MRWLQPSSVYECLHRNLALRANGTCEWILSNPEFHNWVNDNSTSTPKTLIIHGTAGCGKSVLGSFIHRTLQQDKVRQTTKKPITLFFSFSASEMDRRTLDSLARTFLSQLLEQAEDDKLLLLLNGLMEKGPPPTSDMFNALSEAIELLSGPVKAIVDGVDECSDSRDDIYQYLISGFHARTNLDIILLGQTHSISRFLPELYISAIHITPEINSDDMRTIVNHELTRSTLLSSSGVRDNVFTTLLSRADGMFLWVKLMLDYLGASLCDDEVLTRLSDLPYGLEESYTLILDRLANRLDKHQQRLVGYLLSFVTICGRPMSIDEVQHAYALAIKPESHGAQSGLDAFLLRLRSEDIVDICGGLLTFSNGVFHLVHNSARDFLTRPEEDWIEARNPRMHQFRVDPVKSHRLLGNICLRYFRDVDLSQLQWEDLASLDLLDAQQPMLITYVVTWLTISIAQMPPPKKYLINFRPS